MSLDDKLRSYVDDKAKEYLKSVHSLEQDKVFKNHLYSYLASKTTSSYSFEDYCDLFEELVVCYKKKNEVK